VIFVQADLEDGPAIAHHFDIEVEGGTIKSEGRLIETEVLSAFPRKRTFISQTLRAAPYHFP